MNNRSIAVPGAEVAIATRHEQGYISLTDMVKSLEGGSALIEQWLKNKDTELFLGVWEQINNPAFNSLEFEGIRNEAGRNSSYLSRHLQNSLERRKSRTSGKILRRGSGIFPYGNGVWLLQDG